jgi:hypothetical protein
MKNKEFNVGQMAYLLLKEAGICVRCLSEWAWAEFTVRKGKRVKIQHVLCHGCIQYWRAR